jgi:glycosyltransferase involved in cell wall biosynthesis
MKNLRVLSVHNFYQQAGGEDRVFLSEKALLQSYGHEVIEYTDTNDRLRTMNSIAAARQTIWSDSSYQAIKDLIRREKPNMAHFHNTFLLISPSAYYACHEMGVPVVQSLHNYRLFCPSAVFYRDGMICEDCLGKPFAWPGIYHRCYRNSRAQSGLVATFLASHRFLQTWQKKVDVYIALSEFSRRKFIQGGLPAAKIVVKPNFVSEPPGLPAAPGDYMLYLGRLSEEKGLKTLLAAWDQVGAISLKIIGDGPLRGLVENFVVDRPMVDYLGYRDPNTARDTLRGARAVIVPSVCYENFPLAIAEAFACGIPVAASRLGAMAELLDDGRTGLFFSPGDAGDLASKVRWLWDHPGDCARMGIAARTEYEKKYTPERNYELLLEIYSKAMSG